ncbi:MAG: DNA polymerase III subunit delta [Planctomycetota bacterium]|jgi:DNA polymerase-3 subunit delta
MMALAVARSPSQTVAPDASMRILVVAGKDRFELLSLTDRYTAALEAEHGEVERFVLDGAEAGLADVLDELRSYGLLQSHKLVVLDRADEFLTREGFRRGMEHYAESPVDHASLLMRAETWRPGKIDKLVAQVGAVVKAVELDMRSAPRWCVDHAAAPLGRRLAPDAAALLVERIGTERGRLDAELAKLASFVGDAGAIGRDDVAAMVGAGREERGWAIQSVVLRGRAAEALVACRRLVEASPRPREMEMLVMWALMDVLRKLHASSRLLRQGVPPGAAAKRLRIWGDAQRLILDAARRVPPARFAQLLRDTVNADRRVKRGIGTAGRTVEVMTVRVADTVSLGT